MAERLQVSRATVSNWVRRYLAHGEVGLVDHSSKPHRSLYQTARRTERRIVALRFTRRWGPHRIGYHLRLPQSTTSKVLNRYRMPLLGHVDLNTGLPARKAKPVRYERENPGELVHVDVKKLDRFPDGGGWRTLGTTVGVRNKKKYAPIGYLSLHSAIGDRSRLVTNEKKETAAGVLGTRQRVLRIPRHHRAAGDDRQPVLPPLPVLQRRPRRCRAQVHPPLPAANQWEDGYTTTLAITSFHPSVGSKPIVYKQKPAGTYSGIGISLPYKGAETYCIVVDVLWTWNGGVNIDESPSKPCFRRYWQSFAESV